MTSLRSRLTAVVVGMVAVVLVVLALLLYVGVRRAASQQRDDALGARARATAAIAEHEEADYEMVLPPEPRGFPTSYLEVWRSDGSVLQRSPSLTTDLSRENARVGHPIFSDLRLPDGRDGRAITMRFVPRDDANGADPGELVLVVAEGTEAIDGAVASVRTWFIVLGAAGLLATALVTAWSLSRGLRPLADLATHIEGIDDRRLDTRLAVAGQPSELEVPVRKLNELFARLEASFARERQFTADVSHELRTPLAGLRTLLEVTALSDRSTEDYRTALSEALAIVVQLGALAENLLTLARLDAGQLEPEPPGTGGEAHAVPDISLHALVEECWRPHAATAAARSLELRNLIPPATRVNIDREKLRVVIGNLLSNAAEYTSPGGWIAVSTSQDAVLDVTDSGPPLAEDQLERMFDRLWRGDDARSATGVHCGIGLSLARALCGTLSLSLAAATLSDGSVRFRIATASPAGSLRGTDKDRPRHIDHAVPT